MKNKYIICLVLIITVCVIFTFKILENIQDNLSYNNSTKIKENDDIKNIKDLNVISQHNEYILVRDDKYSELETYSIYKNIKYNNYQKQFSFPDGEIIEGRFICWTDDKIYILWYNPKSYSLSNGSVVNTGDLNKILNNTTGRVDRVIGIYDDFIYYTYSYNANNFYAKISLDLNNVTIIAKEDIPEELNNQ